MSNGCARSAIRCMPARASAAATDSARGRTCRRCFSTTKRRSPPQSRCSPGGWRGWRGCRRRHAALRALTKLDQVLPTRLRHEVRALSGSVESFGGGRTPVDPEVLMTLAKACRDEVEAGFDHPSGSEVRRRRVEPYRLVASDRRWYLLAYDLDRDDWRSFRVDRMTDVSARAWRFRPRAAPDAATYVQEGVASRVYPHRARFLVHAPAGTVRARSRRRRPSYGGAGAGSARCSAAPPASTPYSCTYSCWDTPSRYSTLRNSENAVARWRRDCCRPVPRSHPYRTWRSRDGGAFELLHRAPSTPMSRQSRRTAGHGVRGR